MSVQMTISQSLWYHGADFQGQGAASKNAMWRKKFLTLGSVFMDDEKHAVYVNDQVCELTYKEYELLNY